MKRLAFVCLSVAIFAASSCRAEAQSAEDEAQFAGRKAAELTMTLGFCQQVVGLGEWGAFRNEIVRMAGEEEAAQADELYDRSTAALFRMSPRERTRFDRETCMNRIQTLKVEVRLAFEQSVWLFDVASPK